jgi:4-amino-4-deoxy-L-arabinose transferase-like glycosyltransferase
MNVERQLNYNPKLINTTNLDIWVLLGFFLLNFVWFIKLGSGFHVLMGDDLSSWSYYNQEQSFWNSTILNHAADKYRPVWNIIQYALFKLFHSNYQIFFLINILFNYIIVVSLYRLIKLITNGSYLIAVSFSFLYLISRFAYYSLLQLTGLMEALCLFLLIWILYYSVLIYRNHISYSYYLITLYVLIIFTHERFISLFPFIFLLFLFNKQINKQKKIRLILGLIVIVAFNIFLKEIVFQSHLMVGTGGTNISFDIKTFVFFFAYGLLNIVGFNVGPD